MCAYFRHCRDFPSQGIDGIWLKQADESIIDMCLERIGYLAHTAEGLVDGVLRLWIEYDAYCSPIPLDYVIYHLKKCLSNYCVPVRVCILTTNNFSANWLGHTPWPFGKDNRLRILSVNQAVEAEAWLRGC